MVLALFAVREVPSFALALVGGETRGVARYGGVVGTFVPSPGATPRVVDDREDVALHRRGDRWVIELPRVREAKASALIAQLSPGGRLEFREVIDSDAVGDLVKLGLAFADPKDRREPKLEIDRWQPEIGGVHTSMYLYAFDRAVLDHAFVEAEARGWAPPPHTKLVYERSTAVQGGNGVLWRTYLVSDQVGLDGAAVARVLPGNDPNTGRPVVYLDLTPQGARAFEDLTARLVGKKLATLLGGEVKSAPTINGAIRGGRAVIAMGGDDVTRQEQDRADLVESLQAPVLPRGAYVTDAAWVPAANGSRPTIARVILAGLAGVIGYLLAYALVRASRPERRRIAALPAAPGGKLAARLAWTAFAIAVYLVGTQITLPGFNDIELAHIAAAGHSTYDPLQFSIFAIGVTPWLTAFVVVELAASLVTRWRALRDTLDGRRTLDYRVAVLAVACAAMQGYMLIRFVENFDRDGTIFAREMFWPAVATVIAGAMVLGTLARQISARGVGTGFVVLMIVVWLRPVAWRSLSVDADLALAAVIVVATAVVTLGMLGWRVRAPGRVAVPVPAAGIAPLANAGAVLGLFGPLTGLGAHLPAWLDSWPLGLGLLAISTGLWAFAFARPGRRETELVGAHLAPTDRAQWRRATAVTLAALAALFTLAWITPSGPIAKLCDPRIVTVIAAALADVVADARACCRAPLVPVWPLHDPLLVDAARDVLGEIPHFIQGTRVRTLAWIFGSYAPMVVLVPEPHAAEAHARLRDWLTPRT
ncbi:MAG TPA: hypothetical protein VFP84_39425 [Kofleriaceae bacterium]|nr:hypothetical protein [Kofleriaceae bacterium]